MRTAGIVLITLGVVLAALSVFIGVKHRDSVGARAGYLTPGELSAEIQKALLYSFLHYTGAALAVIVGTACLVIGCIRAAERRRRETP